MSAAALADRLAAQVAPALGALLAQAATIAAAQAVPIYLVGGPVRDLILDQPLTDIDLVTAGDAWPVADAFAAQTGGRITRHPAFRTATVELATADGALAIDFVTARREVYPEPAALPVITPSDMRDDLARRDFTINALALELLPGGAGALLDPFAGTADIAAGRIRILHDRSFVDDPTRILRAARFAARFGFTVEPATRALIAQAVAAKMLARTSPQRILNELWLLLAEPRPAEALQLLHAWDALPQLELTWSSAWPAQFAALGARRAANESTSASTLGFGLLVWPLDAAGRARLARRYNLPVAARRLLSELPTAIPAQLAQPTPTPEVLEQLLGRLSDSALAVLELLTTAQAAQSIRRYRREVRALPALLSGADLQAAGMAPGPAYGRTLAAARLAQLRGELGTRADALRWLETRAVDATQTAEEGSTKE